MSLSRTCWDLGPALTVSAPESSPLSAAVNTVFAAFARPPDRAAGPSVELDLHQENGRLLVTADRAAVTRPASLDTLPSLLEGSLGGLAVQTRPDCLVFHAGVVQIDGRLVMLLAGKGSGKSTLSLWLALHGARYFADEHAFVRIEDFAIEAFPKAVTIKKGSAALFNDTAVHPDAVRGPLRYILPSGHAPPREAAPLSGIVVPRFDAESKGNSTPLLPHETALMLVQQCFGGLGRDPTAIRSVANLAELPAALIEYPSCDIAAKRIRDFLTETP